MSVIRPEVVAGWRAFNAPFEGVCNHMYRDCKGLITTSIGILIDPVALALPIPWLRADGEPATEDDIRAEWDRVDAMPPDLLAERYRSPMGLHLSDDAVDALVTERLEATARRLALAWPAFASWPWQAQMGACSMAWAVGAGAARPGLTSGEWPKLHAAFDAQDWRAAADECEIKGRGVDGRNEANRRLFLAAAE